MGALIDNFEALIRELETRKTLLPDSKINHQGASVPTVPAKLLARIKTGEGDTQDAIEDGEFPFYVRSDTVRASDNWTFEGPAVLTSGDGAGVGKIFHYAEGKFRAHQRVYVLRDFKNVDPKYFYWCFQTNFPRQVEHGGAKATVESVRMNMVADTPIPLPPLEKQREIADYLDREISEMDALIEEFEELVSALERRRVKLVEHTFTINTPQSKTGISRVGLLSKMLRRGISPDYSETFGVQVINQKCVRPAGQVDYDYCRLHDESEKKIATNLLVQQGDVLINSTGTGTLGRSALVATAPDAPTTFDSHVTIVRPDKNKVDPAYLAWAIYSQEKRLIDFSVGSTNQIELSRATVANLELPYPPLEKQRQIAEELDREFERMDALIEESTQLIENLKARKTALITEVVTGRKEV